MTKSAKRQLEHKHNEYCKPLGCLGLPKQDCSCHYRIKCGDSFDETCLHCTPFEEAKKECICSFKYASHCSNCPLFGTSEPVEPINQEECIPVVCGCGKEMTHAKEEEWEEIKDPIFLAIVQSWSDPSVSYRVMDSDLVKVLVRNVKKLFKQELTKSRQEGIRMGIRDRLDVRQAKQQLREELLKKEKRIRVSNSTALQEYRDKIIDLIKKK